MNKPIQAGPDCGEVHNLCPCFCMAHIFKNIPLFLFVSNNTLLFYFFIHLQKGSFTAVHQCSVVFLSIKETHCSWPGVECGIDHTPGRTEVHVNSQVYNSSSWYM